MSMLFKNLRIHQIWGANSGVGKTIIASALARTSASRGHDVFYLKPVSIGPHQYADDEHVKRYTRMHKDKVHTECLYRFGAHGSPHLAVKMALGMDVAFSEKLQHPDDKTFADAVASVIGRTASQFHASGHVYVETAGGVHSPTISGTTQLDSYRPLFLPAILVGDSRLGGISSTISSYESLLLRGYIVDIVVLFRDKYYSNSDYLASYFAEHGVRVMAIDPPPPFLPDHAENVASTDNYYEQIISLPRSDIAGVLDHLDNCHASRISELDTMPRRTLDAIWWPFAQHGLVSKEEQVTVIDSAHSDFFSVYNSKDSISSKMKQSESRLEPMFDGSASWWTQAFGHGHPTLALAAARAAGRYGHVMFGQTTHLPALRLAERLLHDGPGKGWASRVFFSDDGSTGMEVALKMALRAFSIRNQESGDASPPQGLGVVGLKGSYHGDTIGVMDACEKGVYSCEWHNAKGFWFDPPTVSIQKGQVVISLPPSISTEEVSQDIDAAQNSLSWAYNIPQRLETPLANAYREYIQRTLQALQDNAGLRMAALVLEPLVMGSGGMIFVDPLFQRIMIDVVRGVNPSSSQWSGLPVIFDEVFVGLYRMGMQSTAPLLGVNPDISVHAKILSGGVVPLAVTLASDSIFQAYLSEKKTDAFLHGHSYTAHPVGCEIANETLDMMKKLVDNDSWRNFQSEWAKHSPGSVASTVWSFWDPNFVYLLSNLGMVQEVMTLGTVLAIRFKDNKGGYGSSTAQVMLQAISSNCLRDPFVHATEEHFGIHFRTLGNVAYFMTSLNTAPATIRVVEERIRIVLEGRHAGVTN